MTFQWIEEVGTLGEPGDGTLGALDASQNLQAKALLQIWVKNNLTAASQLGNLNYGAQPEDHSPTWGFRDGAVLLAFSTWWNGQGNSPTLNVFPTGLPPTLDLSQAHADAINKWAIDNGFLPANWGGPSPVQPPSPIPGIPSIPGFPGIPSIPPFDWPAGAKWPPALPTWWPPELNGIFPPIGQWGAGALQKPPGWELTGLPWPPPVPGATPSFPGTWPKLPNGQSYPFPIPQSKFVSGGTPAPEPTPTGPLPPPPSPIPPPSTPPTTKKASSAGVAVMGLVIVGLIIAAVAAAGQVGSLPAGRLEQNPRRKKTKLQELEEELPPGYSVDTYSPGDGVTRYRFFDKPGQDYFGGSHPLYTALGYKEAYTFAQGLRRL